MSGVNPQPNLRIPLDGFWLDFSDQIPVPWVTRSAADMIEHEKISEA